MTDVAALEAWTEANRRAARSYAAYPTTTGHRETPACANDCGMGARQAGGLCWRCNQAQKRNPMMVARRLAHTPATPTMANRRDEPAPPPCATDDEHGAPNWLKFDRVLEHREGRWHVLAVAAAKAVCATCPLTTKAACLADNHDEHGVIAGLTYAERNPLTAATVRATCGKPHGCTMHARFGEHSCEPCKAARAADRKQQRSKAGGARSEAVLALVCETREARLEDLRELIANGAALGEVLTRLGMTRSALWKWCDRHGHGDEWRRLSPPVHEAIGLRARHNKGRATA